MSKEFDYDIDEKWLIGGPPSSADVRATRDKILKVKGLSEEQRTDITNYYNEWAQILDFNLWHNIRKYIPSQTIKSKKPSIPWAEVINLDVDDSNITLAERKNRFSNFLKGIKEFLTKSES